jgi:hypothetical protein
MDALLEDLVGIRFAQQLPLLQGNNTIVFDPVPSIVNLAKTRVDELLLSLIGVYRRLDRSKSPDLFIRSVERLFSVMSLCLKAQFEHIYSGYNVLLTESSGASEEEQIRIKQKLQAIVPPSLVDADSLLDLCSEMLEIEALRATALELVHFVSLSNVEMVVERIQRDLQKTVMLERKDEIIPGVLLLQSASLRIGQLEAVFRSVADSSAGLKKQAQWHLLSESIYLCIWKWIENYTTEFLALWQDKIQFDSQGALRLFELLETWSKKKGHAAKLWPAQTLLLLLCPAVVVAVAQDKDGEPTKFFQKLKKSMRSSKAALDPATLCLVDLCRASTFVSGPVALRYMSPAIDEELVALLFNAKSTPREGDEALMTNLLVASFRLSPTKITTQLFPQCLGIDAHVIFQQVGIAALLKIARDGAFLPWTPTMQIVYGPLGQTVRALFTSLLDGFVAYDEGLVSNDRKGKQAVDNFLPRARVLITICRLFAVDPFFPIHNPDPAMDFRDMKCTRDVRLLLLGLCDTMRHLELSELSKAARAALLRLHEPEVMRVWVPHGQVAAFWDIGLSVLGALSDVLLAGRDYNISVVHVIVSTLEMILQSRNTCILSMSERDPPTALFDHICFCSAKLEAALLVALAAVDSSVCSSAAVSLGLCCDETDIVGSRVQVPTSLFENYSVYRKISSSASSLVGGRVHQQKQFHNVFFRLGLQTAGNVTAWEELWVRWNMLTTSFVASGGDSAQPALLAPPAKSSSSGANSPALKDSGNLPVMTASSGASGSGVSSNQGSGGLDGSGSLPLVGGDGSNASSAWSQTMGLLLSLCGILEDRSMPKRNVENLYKPASALVAGQLQGTSGLLHFFFVQLMGLLVSESVAVREGARSVIASSMSPLVIASFLRLLHSTVRSWFDESGLTVRRDDTDCAVLVDQTVSVWKLFLDRKLVQSDLTSLSVVFEDLMLCLARYMAQVLVEKTPMALQIRLKFCSLVESVCENASIIPWTDERRFREVLVDMMMEWTSFFALKDDAAGRALSSSAAVVGVVSPLSLSSVSSSSSMSPTSSVVASSSGSGGGGGSGAGGPIASSSSSSSVLFYEGFPPLLSKLAKDLDVSLMSALATLLTELALEADNSTSRGEKFTKLFSFLSRVMRIARGNQVLSPKLADIAIHALSELLAANTEAGLPYFVTMG